MTADVVPGGAHSPAQNQSQRIYIPLPDAAARAALLAHLLRTTKSSLRPADFEQIANKTNGACAGAHRACAGKHGAGQQDSQG